MTTESYPARLRARIESRDTRLQSLGYRDYNAYLNSAGWVKVKAQFRKFVAEACGLCESEENLQLHHLTYERVGEESMFDLTWLCRNCHAMVHALEARGTMGLDFAGLTDMKRAAEYAAANVEREQRRAEELEAAAAEPERDDHITKGKVKKIFYDIDQQPLERKRVMLTWLGDVCRDIDKVRVEGGDIAAACEDMRPIPF